MVDAHIRNNIFIVIDSATPGAKSANEEWLAEDINIITSNDLKGATIVIDFSYGVLSIVDFTLDSGSTWVSFNEGVAVTGGQSRYIRVTKGDQVNFRAQIEGTLNRAVIGEV